MSTGNFGRGVVASLAGKHAQRWAVLPGRILIFRVGRLETSPRQESSQKQPLKAPDVIAKRSRAFFTSLNLSLLLQASGKMDRQWLCSLNPHYPVLPKCQGETHAHQYPAPETAARIKFNFMRSGVLEIGKQIKLGRTNQHFHSQNEFARGKCHVNGIESFWSFAKRRLAQFNGLSDQTLVIISF